MQIKLMQATDDLFLSWANLYVCPVNMVGAMDAGISRLFLQRFPTDCQKWIQHCALHNECVDDSTIQITKRLFTEGTQQVPPEYVCFLPVHQWPGPADLDMVTKGLTRLAAFVEANKVERVAIPALGCGIGGLDWEKQVLPAISNTFLTCHQEGEAELFPPR